VGFPPFGAPVTRVTRLPFIATITTLSGRTFTVRITRDPISREVVAIGAAAERMRETSRQFFELSRRAK
jgi:hypothetical protein